jgi:hypothetical protein
VKVCVLAPLIGFILIIDETFNINNLRLPFLIAVSINNLKKTFPVVFSYCPSESKDNYDFFFKSLKAEVFNGNITIIKVVITD